MLLNGDFFENVDRNYDQEKPETHPETLYVNEKHSVIVKCYISLEMF